MLTYKRHDYSARVPDMKPEDLAGLEADIRENGQLDPITIYKDQVLDGWHRYQILLKLGQAPRFVVYHGNNAGAAKLVLSRLKGRNLNAGELGMLADDLTRAVNGDDGIDDSDTFSAEKVLPAKGMSIPEAAAVVGVSPASVSRARKIKTHAAPEVVEAVRAGEVSLNDGDAVAKLPHKTQTAALEQVRTGKSKTLREAAGVESNGHGNAKATTNQDNQDKPCDSIHVPIPELAQPAFAIATQIAKACRTIDGLIREVTGMQKAVGGRLIHGSVVQHLQSVRKTLYASRATHVCPYCGGTGNGCDPCKGEGWTTASYFDAAPPEKKSAMKKRGTSNVPV